MVRYELLVTCFRRWKANKISGGFKLSKLSRRGNVQSSSSTRRGVSNSFDLYQTVWNHVLSDDVIAAHVKSFDAAIGNIKELYDAWAGFGRA